MTDPLLCIRCFHLMFSRLFVQTYMLPDSPVPRAKMRVMALQAALLVTSIAVLEPPVLPPPVLPPPGKPGKENVGKENAGDLLVGGSELGRAMAPAASARRSVLEKRIMVSDPRY